ncbi:MAG: hypothetical protein IT435_20415 [Phycisphaerales bacterium]|nr:hypothetical protein [Phycisphaerales bacterium]
MFSPHRTGLAMFAALIVGLGSTPTLAGPSDISTNYPVGLEVGGKSFSGIVDSGGITTLSFEDAKAAGLLDENGDPVNPPDGSVNVGGTGGGSVKCHKFNKVKVKVQPKNADGTNNGDPKEIEVTVLVPKKPADQDGADDAAKKKKTDSVITKAGRNIAGATIDGSKLELTDKETKEANKNSRSTGWQANVNDGHEVPFNEDPNDQDDIEVPCSTPMALLNGNPMPIAISTASVGVMPLSMAMDLGGIPLGTRPVDPFTQRALFIEGHWPNIPQDHPVNVQVFAINVVLPSLADGPLQNSGPAHFLAAPFFQQPMIGGNGLIPENWSATLDSETGLINFVRYCPADFDHSGFVDLEDYAAFVQSFEEGTGDADFDGSGFVDIEDFTGFVLAFEAGC